MGEKSVLIFIFVLLFSSVLPLSFYYLYHAPMVGITTTWDEEQRQWKAATSRSWGSLKQGDAINAIGDLRVGFHHLLLDNIHLSSRDELFSWLETKKKVYEKLMEPGVIFLVERNGANVRIPVSPGKAGFSFLN